MLLQNLRDRIRAAIQFKSLFTLFIMFFASVIPRSFMSKHLFSISETSNYLLRDFCQNESGILWLLLFFQGWNWYGRQLGFQRGINAFRFKKLIAVLSKSSTMVFFLGASHAFRRSSSRYIVFRFNKSKFEPLEKTIRAFTKRRNVAHAAVRFGVLVLLKVNPCRFFARRSKAIIEVFVVFHAKN